MILPRAWLAPIEQVNPRFRLVRSADFKRVRRYGKSFAHPLVVLIILPNGLNRTRIAVAAGRSVGKAVDRNRAKRLLRAAIQPLIPSIQSGWDMILLARKPLAQVNCQETQIALISLLKRAHLLAPPDEHSTPRTSTPPC